VSILSLCGCCHFGINHSGSSAFPESDDDDANVTWSPTVLSSFFTGCDPLIV